MNGDNGIFERVFTSALEVFISAGDVRCALWEATVKELASDPRLPAAIPSDRVECERLLLAAGYRGELTGTAADLLAEVARRAGRHSARQGRHTQSPSAWRLTAALVRR